MCVNGSVPSRSGQVLVFSIRYVHSNASVIVLFSETKVDQEKFIAVTTDAHQKVVRLDVAMNKELVVDKLNASDHLVCEHEHRFQCKTSSAKCKQIFKGRSQKFEDKYVVSMFLAAPAKQ